MLRVLAVMCSCSCLWSCASYADVGEPISVLNKQMIVETSTLGKHNQVIEKEKLVKYQLRHNYNMYCKTGNYAVIDYSGDGGEVNLTLLSEQTITLKETCVVEGQLNIPKNMTYVYK